MVRNIKFFDISILGRAKMLQFCAFVKAIYWQQRFSLMPVKIHINLWEGLTRLKGTEHRKNEN